jgi:hypothetical protein
MSDPGANTIVDRAVILAGFGLSHKAGFTAPGVDKLLGDQFMRYDSEVLCTPSAQAQTKSRRASFRNADLLISRLKNT